MSDILEALCRRRGGHFGAWRGLSARWLRAHRREELGHGCELFFGKR